MARISEVHCICSPEFLSCRVFQRSVCFDTEPTQYFVLKSGVDLPTALKLAQLYREDRVRDLSKFPDLVSRLKGSDGVESGAWLDAVEQEGENFVLGFYDGGCSTDMLVSVEREEGEDVLRVLEARLGGCS